MAAGISRRSTKTRGKHMEGPPVGQLYLINYESVQSILVR